MKRDDKRKYRELKRTLKRRGHKRVRQQLTTNLNNSPETAHELEYTYEAYRSASLNGIDCDGTRQKRENWHDAKNTEEI